MTIVRALAVLACLTIAPAVAPAVAQTVDFIETDGPLTDDEFYNIVACSAPPGAPCTASLVRWGADRAARLSVGFAPIDPDYPPQLARQLSNSLDLAIASINGIGAALHLERANKDAWADIRIHLAPISAGDVVTQTGIEGIDGATIGAALFNIWWDNANNIYRAVIVMADDIPLSDAYPVLLEELTQSMGMTTDIRNPYYETRSVFSEDSNSVTKHGPQDIMAVRRHYPPT